MAESARTARYRRLLVWTGVPVIAIVLLAVFWQWDWFIPIVESRVGSAIGRTVTIGHLHITPGRVIEVTADDVTVANPAGWPEQDPPLGAIRRITIRVDAWDYIRGRGLVVPLIAVDQPRIFAAETETGKANFRLKTGGGGGASPKIGDLRITDGRVRVIMPKLKSDFTATIATQEEGGTPKLLAQARGTYANQPIMAHFISGGLLSLRDKTNPWPVDLTIQNGPTRVAIRGTVQDPLALKGANVTLQIAGPNMGLLQPLVGFPIPKTPAYEIGGKLDFAGLQNIRFEDFRGRLGNSDIEGTIVEAPGAKQENGKLKPVVTMDLHSNRVDLADLNGFIGGEPGRTNTANETPQQRATVARANASPRLLPNQPINVPRLNWADIHLRYRGSHIEGRNIPLDNLYVALDIVNGQITVHPISFGIGTGRLLANADLTPESEKRVHAKMDIRMENVDVARLMAATHMFHGAGSVSGVGAIDATGNSVASLLAHGNGGIKMAMAGGDLSALLVDLSGLQFGNALMSALGMPQKTQVQCFVTDLGLREGVLDFDAVVLDTGEAITNVGGNINLGSERLGLDLKTDAKHFSIGSLPTRIAIRGTFKHPSILPGAQLAARAGAAVGLGVLFAPLAILPTVQFGTSAQEDARCGNLLRQARESAGGRTLPAPKGTARRESPATR